MMYRVCLGLIRRMYWGRCAVLGLCGVLLASVGLSVAVLAPAGAQENRVLRIEADAPRNADIALPLGKSLVLDFAPIVQDVLVADPNVVEAVPRSPQQIYLLGTGVGHTNVFFFDSDGQQILDLEVGVDRDLTLLRKTLARYLPEAEIEVEAMQEQVILSGLVDSASMAASAQDIAGRFIGSADLVLNLLEISTEEQVLLKVTIAEMERSIMKDLGLDWQVRYADGDRWSLGLAQVLPSGAAGSGSGLFSGFYPGGSGFGQSSSTLSSFGFGSQSPTGSGQYRAQIDTMLKALESQGLLKTLAEPNLTALSGETATFLAGGEIPIPSGRDDTGVLTVSFEDYGVSLEFTPVVQDEGRISLQISTEVSEITPIGAIVQGDITIPGIKTRRAETTVELPSGGSLVIAGLLSENTEQEVAGPPGLKDFPVPLLFRSTGFGTRETELVIVVTPYLVEPSHRDELVLPTDGFIPPDTAAQIFEGRLNRAYGKEQVKGSLRGPGFVLE